MVGWIPTTRERSIKRLIRTVVTIVVVCGFAVSAHGNASEPGGTFTDDNGSVHEGGIEALAAAGITQGCNPPANTEYCPSDVVTRGQMALFLSRSLNLGPVDQDFFDDDEGTVYENGINRIAEAGITLGCDPQDDTRFCPDAEVTRGQMAAMLTRAFDLPASSTDHFTDDDGHIFESAINRVADAGITVGCDASRYCPNTGVTRDQMATFLTRAVDGLSSMKPPPVTTFGPGTFSVGTDIPPGVYRNTGYSDGCYWERLSGFSGGFDDIVANNFTNVGQIVEIKGSDAGFDSDQDCGTWSNQLVNPQRPDPEADFGPGTYRVVEEVAPGIWRSDPVPGDNCYWERRSGFGGQIADIIASDFTDSTSQVEISETDAGFYSEDGCGIWTRVG